jgi:GNAT superfamily N-acetyltransferase
VATGPSVDMLTEFTHLREASKEDLEYFDKEMSENTFNDYYKNWFSDSYNFGRKKANDGFCKKFLTIVDLKSDDTPRGLVEIRRHTERTVATLGFVVYEEFKGHGRGKNAIVEVLEMCAKMGITNILLDTTSPFLVNYYKQFGFEVVCHKKKTVRLMNYEFADEYILQKIEKEVPKHE